MISDMEIWSKSTVLEASLLHWTMQALQGNEQGRPFLGCYVEILRTRSGARVGPGYQRPKPLPDVLQPRRC